ncbi:MAG TPA: heavy metal translocating P-type ATPase [Ignavibacteria bacterium]|nr:heavy metal translocating P-type ATPase [Ignavibacteria bacterium]
MSKTTSKTGVKCHYCGNDCNETFIRFKDKYFCRHDCKDEFEKSLPSLTSLPKAESSCCCSSNEATNIKIEDPADQNKFNFLDDSEIRKKIVNQNRRYNGKNVTSVSLSIPGIHCTSCVGMLENIYRTNPGILSSKVEFLQKQIHIIFDSSVISLKEIVKVLSDAGYEAKIDLHKDNENSDKSKSSQKDLYIKIGVAGFCLGNIMLLSFPEYFSGENFTDNTLKTFFNYLNILLSLPVFFYCSSGYFKSAWSGLKQKVISIDIPISLGITALFVRSLYEIIFFNNAGYMDSMAGLVFFLLLGKLFQSKTYESLNFERDYRSYFPVSVTVIEDKIERSIPVANLRPGDRILIRNNEIVPADSILFGKTSSVDYSFVSGESIPELKVAGEIIYAGGRHLGSSIELEVIRTVSQSHLTKLWNDPAFKKNNTSKFSELTDFVSKYFTIAVLAIAVTAALYWLPDINKAVNVFTTVLIVACPCALALTTPFAFGNAQRILGRNKFYLKNSSVVENLANVNSIVFDKTGTLTNSKDLTVTYSGVSLSTEELAQIKTLVRNSSHPLSKNIYDFIDTDEYYEAEDFKESVGEGISCRINGNDLKLGSVRFIVKDPDCSFKDLKKEYTGNAVSSNVFLSVNDSVKGYFSFRNKYRNGIMRVIEDLSEKYKLTLLSGDNNSEKENLSKYFNNESSLLFNQSPQDKLNYIKHLQSNGDNILMIGDGLNDAGALKQSNTGITISEDITNFSPSCDAIAEASEFSKFGKFMEFSRSTMNIIRVSFVISFLYNVIGLYLASTGVFSPLVAAILMPLNSISIVIFVTIATNFSAKLKKL